MAVEQCCWKHSVQVEGRLKRGTVSGLELCATDTHCSAAAGGVSMEVSPSGGSARMSSHCLGMEWMWMDLESLTFSKESCSWVLKHPQHGASRDGPSQEGQGRSRTHCSRSVQRLCWADRPGMNSGAIPAEWFKASPPEMTDVTWRAAILSRVCLTAAIT